LNCTIQEFGSVSIYEPCNYASNVAYYYTVTEMCDHEGWTLPIEEGKALDRGQWVSWIFCPMEAFLKYS
jgi:hypothetical protein